LVEFRDGVDMLENFEMAKYSIKDSMTKFPDNWRKNIRNHYHYLLYKSSRRIKNYHKDPLYTTMRTKEKNFSTVWGALTHFKYDISILSRNVDNSVQKGDIPELVLEPNMEFYKELKRFFTQFTEKFVHFIEYSEKFLKVNFRFLRALFKPIIEDMQEAIDICIKGIELQESGKLDSFEKNILRKALHYDMEEVGDKWLGWYTKLFAKDDNTNLFNLEILLSKIYTAPPVDKLKFNGSIMYHAMRFPVMGVLVKQDPFEKKEKLLLFAAYGAKEINKPFDRQIKFDDVAKSIIDRE
jgi:hypothetical protein